MTIPGFDGNIRNFISQTWHLALGIVCFIDRVSNLIPFYSSPFPSTLPHFWISKRVDLAWALWLWCLFINHFVVGQLLSKGRALWLPSLLGLKEASFFVDLGCGEACTRDLNNAWSPGVPWVCILPPGFPGITDFRGVPSAASANSSSLLMALGRNPFAPLTF